MNDKFEKYTEIGEIIKEVFNDAKEKESYIDYPNEGGGESTFFREKYKTFDDWYDEKGKNIIIQLMTKVEE